MLLDGLKLSSLPVPALSLITDLLYLKSVRRLYLCGDVALNMRIRNGGVSQLQYNFGAADAWRYRGGEHSGKFTPIPRQFPVEGITNEELIATGKKQKDAMMTFFNFPLLLPRLRVLSVYRYVALSSNTAVLNILQCVGITLPELPPTLETLDLRFSGAWIALLYDTASIQNPIAQEGPVQPALALRDMYLGLTMTLGRFTLTNPKSNKWRPLRTLFPGLRHLIVSSEFQASHTSTQDLMPIEHLQRNFINDALPSNALELLDVDFLPASAYSQLTADKFPHMDCLSISTMEDASWPTVLESKGESPAILSMWSHLPSTLSRLVVPTLTLTLSIMKVLPKMLSELEVKFISQELDPYLVSQGIHLDRDIPDSAAADLLRPDNVIAEEENNEDLFLAHHPVDPFPLPPYLASLTTSRSFYWTRTLARRVPSSVSIFRLRKAYSFQMRTFAALPGTVSSFVIFFMSQESGARPNPFHRQPSMMMGLNIESLVPLSNLHLDYIRIASSAGAIKCKIPYEDDLVLPLFPRLESLVLPRATISEDCLLALPRTLRRLDVERIRATGTLLHYFDEERKVRTGLTERETELYKKKPSRNPQGFVPVKYMERLTNYFVRGKDVPAKYYDDPLYTKPIEIIDVELLERAITVFCNVHFPGLQEFLPPIACLSITWAPITTTEIHLDSSTIPFLSLPCLSRMSALNLGRYVEWKDLSRIPNLVELDWTTSNTSLRLAEMMELPTSVTRIIGWSGCCVYDSTNRYAGDDNRLSEQTNAQLFSWRSVVIHPTAIGSYYRYNHATPPLLSDAGQEESSSDSNSTIAPKLLPKWRREDIADSVKRLTLPDDIGRLSANLMGIELCGGASFSYEMSGRFLVRAFPSTLQELILRGTGFQSVKWTPPASTMSDNFNITGSLVSYDPTFSACVEVPPINPYLGKSLFFRPWNYIEPSKETPVAATAAMNQASSQNPISLNSSGKSRYNDKSRDTGQSSLPLYPSVLTQVKLIFGAISQYPLNILPSWLTRLHFERHIIRPSILADMADFLPNLATLIITNECLLAADFEEAPTSSTSQAPKTIVIGAGTENPNAFFKPWEGNDFASLLPKTLTKLVVDCVVLPYWTEVDYVQLPPGLTELYLSPQSKNDEKEILAWIAARHGNKSLETSEETQWLSAELAKRHPPELRGSEGVDLTRSME